MLFLRRRVIDPPEKRVSAVNDAITHANGVLAELAQLRRQAAREIYARPGMTYAKLGALLGVTKVGAAQLVNSGNVVNDAATGGPAPARCGHSMGSADRL